MAVDQAELLYRPRGYPESGITSVYEGSLGEHLKKDLAYDPAFAADPSTPFSVRAKNLAGYSAADPTNVSAIRQTTNLDNLQAMRLLQELGIKIGPGGVIDFGEGGRLPFGAAPNAAPTARTFAALSTNAPSGRLGDLYRSDIANAGRAAQRQVALAEPARMLGLLDQLRQTGSLDEAIRSSQLSLHNRYGMMSEQAKQQSQQNTSNAQPGIFGSITGLFNN